MTAAILVIAVPTIGQLPAEDENRSEEVSDPSLAAADEGAELNEALAAEGLSAPSRSLDTSPAAELVVGEIEIRVGDIFDPSLPGENRLLFRLANRLHSNTRVSVIAQQLLFEEGDRYDEQVVEESARQLREKRYLRDAEIVPVRYDGGRVDLAVVTRDVWTLNAGLGLGRSGGVNRTHIQVEDYSLFGTGKGLTALRTTNVDRSSSEINYRDSNLLGGRWQLDAVLADNSDGSRHGLEIGRPFFSLDSRWSVGLKALSEVSVESLYDLGLITDQFGHRRQLLELSGGLSSGRVGDRVHRWTSGFTYVRDQFEPAPSLSDGSTVEGLVPGFPPESRTLAYPWVAFDSLEDSYLTARNHDRMDRIEDLDLGRRFHLRLGLSSKTFGATEDTLIFDALFGTGLRTTAMHTLLYSSDLSGRWGRNGAENLRLGLGARYYWRNFGDHLFFATLQGHLARQLDSENQILLGGDSGLRGYPLRYQAGERSMLLTLEQRFFTNLNPLKLFRVGVAAFLDVGRVWDEKGAGGPSDLGFLTDVGVGLRLGSTRSGRGSVVHVDVAFPLDGDGSIRSLQWLIKSKESF